MDVFLQAFAMILQLKPELLHIILLSLRVSGLALLAATLLGLPLGAVMGIAVFPGRSLAITLANTFMGLPPVVVGLVLYLLLSRSGCLGFLGLLYTPSAMILAQTILALPIVASLCHSAIVGVDPLIRQAASTLGATPLQQTLTVVGEARYGILSAIIAAFGRVMAEVGAILIVGGNIAGYTRVMTTTIALETDQGEFELALALGMVLLSISLVINLFLHYVQQRGKVHSPR
ncbi:MAG: ABC transporter permease subunit [Deltaproteobacteria bacterium]|nr:ABC transporter permease subunit [Deltaproteobacteria bacterium]